MIKMFVVLCEIRLLFFKPVFLRILVLAGAKGEGGVEYKVGVCPPLTNNQC